MNGRSGVFCEEGIGDMQVFFNAGDYAGCSRNLVANHGDTMCNNPQTS